MSTEMNFQDLLLNIRTIFKVASSKCKVLDESFPARFFEKDPNKIFESYTKFIKSRSGADGLIKNEEKLALTTISDRFDSGDYSANLGGFYKLYHDVKLVCTLLIHYYPQGTRNYQMVDKFYKFATELLLRECYKLGALLVDCEPKDVVGNQSEDNELSHIIGEDFIKISTNYQVPLTQTYHIKTKDQDLFSSTIARSLLDERPRELPNSNFEINKVIPQTNICEEAPRMGFVAANTSNIPDPTLPPTEMMTRFLHPNWYALPTTMWLQYGEYRSWAPSFNENGTVIDSTTRGIIWLERIGYLDMFKKYNKSKHSEDESLEVMTTKVTEQKEGEKDIENKFEGADKNATLVNGKGEEMLHKKPLESPKQSDSHATEHNRPLSIKLENLFEWSPASYIEDDVLEHMKSGTHSKLVTSALLRMKKLRKDRIANRASSPSIEEIKTYHKVRIILKEVLLSRQASKLPMNHCRSFPVLQANYNGGIPVVRVQPSRKRKSKK